LKRSPRWPPSEPVSFDGFSHTPPWQQKPGSITVDLELIANQAFVEKLVTLANTRMPAKRSVTLYRDQRGTMAR
jgi:hypothetical protein